ncbi:hypothetical protein ACFOY2_35085 [Nonomuraea purpurea]|uniref:Adenine DNA glycosylase n=1 Tax=Nonomuraea purpurea TaxID=1849276 RepID=A0ABV8GHU1_9ACTN
MAPLLLPSPLAGTLGHRWWSVPELDAAPERIFPPRLTVLLKDLFRGVRHERPVTLDW